MPTILYIVTRGDTFGGVQTHVRDLAEYACGESSKTIVAHGPGDVFPKMLAEVGVDSVVLPHLGRAIHPIRDTRAFFEIVRLIRRVRPAFVSLHTSKAGILGRLACAVTRTPCIFTAHGWSFTTGIHPLKRLFYLVLEKLTMWPAQIVVCVSQYDKDLALRYHVATKKLVVVHNAVRDLGAKKEYGTGTPCRAVMVGRIDPQKDHKMLIDALARVPGMTATFIGGGTQEEYIKKYAQERGVYNRTIFMGAQKNAAELLHDFDLFLLISHWEGFPRSTLEALAAGLPVIVSDVGGSREAITDGVEGFVVSRGDTEQLVEKLKFFVEHPKEREKMGRAARKRFEARFTLERFFGETCALYRDLVQ